MVRKRVVDLVSRNVCWSLLRYDDRQCYVDEGYGGEDIETWPVFDFLNEHLYGNRTKALNNFEAWYTDQFARYYRTAKASGGMHKGSLYKLIENKHDDLGLAWDGTLSNAQPDAVKEAIQQKVKERVQLADHIKSQGYDVATTERIIGVRKKGYVYLKGGHHRWAILKLLGYRCLPHILVIPGQKLYNLLVAGGALG